MHLVSIARARRGALIAVALLAAAGCSSTTAVRNRPLEVRRTTWADAKLADYEYDYELGSFWFVAYQGHWIHLVVRADTVRSAVDLTTKRALEPASSFPTVNELLDQAQAAAANGALKSITYDPQYGYPTAMDFAGPPDASGWIYAANLRPLP